MCLQFRSTAPPPQDIFFKFRCLLRKNQKSSPDTQSDNERKKKKSCSGRTIREHPTFIQQCLVLHLRHARTGIRRSLWSWHGQRELTACAPETKDEDPKQPARSGARGGLDPTQQHTTRIEQQRGLLLLPCNRERIEASRWQKVVSSAKQIRRYGGIYAMRPQFVLT